MTGRSKLEVYSDRSILVCGKQNKQNLFIYLDQLTMQLKKSQAGILNKGP